MSYAKIKKDGTASDKTGRKPLPESERKVQFTMYEYPKIIELNGGMYAMKETMLNSLKR